MLGRKRKKGLIRSEDDILEEEIRKKEKAYSGEKEPEKKEYVCGFCGEPFETHQKLSWHIRRKHKGEKPPAEGAEEVEELGEEPMTEKPSLEEVIYGFSGHAALLINLKRFELTEAEADAIDVGVELITNAVGMYLNELRSREEK